MPLPPEVELDDTDYITPLLEGIESGDIPTDWWNQDRKSVV